MIIPNAFTPDLDGINDVFLPVNTCGFSEFRLSVFNRWGQLVFFSDQPGSGWDGTFDGEQVPSDVYVFVLDFRANAPGATAMRRKGSVTLLR